MANTKLNFEYKNLRVSTRDWASIYHVDCDIYLNGEFITAYTYNPWWLLENACKKPRGYEQYHKQSEIRFKNGDDRDIEFLIEEYPETTKFFFGQHFGKHLREEKAIEIRDAILNALDGKFPKEIQPDDDSVIESLALDSQVMEATFFDFCNDCGYDSDSISALETYNECSKLGRKLVKMGVFNEIQDERERIEG